MFLNINSLNYYYFVVFHFMRTYSTVRKGSVPLYLKDKIFISATPKSLMGRLIKDKQLHSILTCHYQRSNNNFRSDHAYF